MKHEGANISFKQMERIKNDTQKKKKKPEEHISLTTDIKITKNLMYEKHYPLL